MRNLLPPHCTIVGNFELKIPGRRNTFEYDAVVITDRGIYAIEMKGWSGTIRGDMSRWDLEWRRVENPLIRTEQKAKALTGALRSNIPRWPSGLGCQSLVYLIGRNLELEIEPADDPRQAHLLQTDTLQGFFESEAQATDRVLIDETLRQEILAYMLPYSQACSPDLKIPNYEIETEVEAPPGAPYREFRARHMVLTTRPRMRVKVYDLDPLVPSGERDAMINRVLRDMQVLDVMRENPYVSHAYEFMRDAEEGSRMYIVSEDVGERSLRDVIDSEELSQGQRWWLAWHMMRALADVHAHGIVHRNLHPEVIPLTEGGDVPLKIADFDFARVEHLSSISGEDLSLGTEGYTAPELWLDDTVYDRRVDVFSAGAIALELITGQPLYEDVNEMLRHREMWAERREAFEPTEREIWDGLLAFDPVARIEDLTQVLPFFEARSAKS